MSIWSILFGHAMAAQPNVNVGQPALSFALPAINESVALDTVRSNRVALSDFTGPLPREPRSVVVVHFFDQSSAGDTLSELNRLQKRYVSKDVQVIGISTDDGEVASLSTWVENLDLNFPVLRDGHQVVLNRYGFDSLPFTMIVDTDGFIFAMGNPSGPDFEEAVTAEIIPLVEAE
jgi:peroxiredoxin